MSVRLYIGNLPQTFDSKELDSLLATFGDGIRFKPVFDRESGACRGFGFANVANEKLANELIEKLNGQEFKGIQLRVERSERRDSNSSGRKNGSNKTSSQGSKGKSGKKVIHRDAPNKESPDPRWAGELSKLKDLLANQKTSV